MLAPVIKRIVERTDAFVERTLPVKGTIYVKAGDKPEPYDHIGDCIYAGRSTVLSKHFRPKGYKKNGQFYYANMDLGYSGRAKVTASYNGYLFKNKEGHFEFSEVERKYSLLSGVWGEVLSVVDAHSVLLKAHVNDISVPVATNSYFSGELVVFPNPSSVLEKYYLDDFSASAADGKIVYVGNHVNMSMLEEAIKSGWGGILAGSTDVDTYSYAKAHGIPFGVFSGFGDVPTPEDVYTFLNKVTNRYVFFSGDKHFLRIPMPFDAPEVGISKKTPLLKQVKKGDSAVALQRPYFGFVGVVDRVLESSILIKFPTNQNPTEIFYPNFLILG